jgi:hypothetical protein
MREIFARLLCSLTYPLFGFWGYWRDLGRALERGTLEGGYSIPLLWGGVVTLVLIVAIYLYYPLAKKIEPGSIVSYIGLYLAMIVLLIGHSMEWYEYSTTLEKAWGEYIFRTGLWLPLIHIIFRAQEDKHYKFSAFGRPRLVEDVND